MRQSRCLVSCTRPCRGHGVFARGRTHVRGARPFSRDIRPCRAQISARARRRRRGRAAVCGPVRGAAAARRRRWSGTSRRRRSPDATSSTTRSIATRSRCGACSKRSSRTRTASIRPRWRDPALHEAVLDQQRPLQQPDRAQVRAEDHAAGVRRGGADGGEGRRDVPDAVRRVARRDAGAAASRCSSTRTSIPIVTNKTPGAGQGHPDRQRQQPVLRRQHGRPQGLHREDTGSTRAS